MCDREDVLSLTTASCAANSAAASVPYNPLARRNNSALQSCCESKNEAITGNLELIFKSTARPGFGRAGRVGGHLGTQERCFLKLLFFTFDHTACWLWSLPKDF